MSMYRTRNQKKRWRTKWPWKQLFPLRVDERFCSECRLPFHEGPLPKEVDRLFVNNVAALVFPAGSWKKDEVVIRVGRWKPGAKQFYFSEFIPASDLESLLNVVQQAQEKYAPERNARATGR